MKNDPLAATGTRVTPQSRSADPRQAPNSAGGYSFVLDDLARLRRFLVLGVDGGTYYAIDHELAVENAEVVTRLASTSHRALVDEVVAVSEAGRAPRPNPALFALAVAASHGTADERRYALDRLPRVARTGTHLYIFTRYVELFRGWGRQLRRAVGDWYLRPPVVDVAYQCVKYRQREGWSHRDLLRLAHPVATDPARRALFDWITHHRLTHGVVDLELLDAFEQAQRYGALPDDWVRLVTESSLSWEMLPDIALAHPPVWEALLARPGGVPATALLRQLPRLTRLGLLTPLGALTRDVCARLADPERLRRGRVHPLSVLVALRVYASGAGVRGRGTWTPSRPVVDALDAAFYASFGAVEPVGKNVMLALDVSASMTWHTVAGLPITPREASAALALVTATTESSYELVGFHSGASGFTARHSRGQNSGIAPLTISPRQRLDDVTRYVGGLYAGGTDCALPMLYALENQLAVETFVIYTDNETWAGGVHPHQALRRYRERTGIPAKLVVVGMTSTGFTVADPGDAGMLDVVGFDAATPNLLADFARGEVT